MEPLKTSEEWAEIYKEKGLIILDPDGWDRENFEFSWKKELLTEENFLRKVSTSTTITNLSRL
jgi:hypothetical protein